MKNYRTEIDGLRAVAVLSVILYHLDHAYMPAGYAGVDIFFVISGFLVGGIIARERADRSFSYTRFYARRARRIFPALFVILLTTLVVGYFVLLPRELRYLGGSAVSTLLFSSNFWYYTSIDYFNPLASSDALLHTWSLAVEEQFYLFLPIAMGLLWRFGIKVVMASLMLVTVVSFYILISTNASHTEATFYFIHARAWELLTGVIVAMLLPKVTLSETMKRILANIGFGLIVFGFLATPEFALWPGKWTVFPVLGSLLILAFGDTKSLVNQVLSSRAFVFVGAISYSAYLWHQPVIAYLKVTGLYFDQVLFHSALLGGILTLAWLSWRFVEQPFRTSNMAPWKFWAFLGGLSMAIMAIGIGGHITKGFPQRLPADVQHLLASDDLWPSASSECMIKQITIQDYNLNKNCTYGINIPPTVALWGDSKSAGSAVALGNFLGNKGKSLIQFSFAGCVPIPNLINAKKSLRKGCDTYNTAVLDYLVNNADIKTVILYAYWVEHLLHEDFRTFRGALIRDDRFFHLATRASDMDDVKRLAAIAQKLQATVKTLSDAGKKTLIIYPLPTPNFNVVDHVASERFRNGGVPENLRIPYVFHKGQADRVTALLDTVLQTPNAFAIDLSDRFCDPQKGCLIFENGKSLYADNTHLSLYGVNKLVAGLAPWFDP